MDRNGDTPAAYATSADNLLNLHRFRSDIASVGRNDHERGLLVVRVRSLPRLDAPEGAFETWRNGTLTQLRLL